MDLSEEWRKLRPALGDMICHIDSKMQSIEAEEKRIQEKRGESYLRGLNDMAQTVIAFTGPVEEGCMAPTDMKNYVGCTSVSDALNIMSLEEFIEKCNKWKADKKKKEDEIQIGDEVEVSDKDYVTYGEKYIVTRVDHLKHGSGNDMVWFITSDFHSGWLYSAVLKKTGRHFDSIPLKEKKINEFSI